MVKKQRKEEEEKMFDLEEYIKTGCHRLGCPAWLKVRELDILMRIVPGPLGLGMSQRQAASHMGIHRNTVDRIINQFKERFPEAWDRVISMRRVMERQRNGMHQSRSMDGLVAALGEGGLQEQMVDDSSFEM